MIHPAQSICDLQGLRSLEQSSLRHSLERTDFEQLKRKATMNISQLFGHHRILRTIPRALLPLVSPLEFSTRLGPWCA